MTLFFQQVIDGIATGSIYASLALALVLIYRSTHIVNFAQGEMAMFSTFIAWQFHEWGWPIWGAIGVTLAISFVGGMAVERTFVRPVENAPVLTIVIVTLGLLLIFNQSAGWLWNFLVKSFASPFPRHVVSAGDVRVSTQSIGIVVVLFLTLLVLWLLFDKTKIGLAMRAAAENPESSGLVGINVGRMLMLGWGLAATLGALSGVMVAPRLFLEPNMMVGVLLYGFAGALLGGVSNPIGAVIGGFIVGVLEALVGTYVPFVGNELKLSVALVLIVGVLVFKPSGLFGRVVVRRV